MPARAEEILTIDRLDRRLIHALMRDGRLPFRRIAEVLGASEQTIARRYRRLREAGVVRVIAIRNPRRYRDNVFVRIRTTPGAARAIGEALVRRDDVAWATLGVGGAEVSCSVRSDDPHSRDALILERLPRLGQVTGVTAATVLNVFAGGPRAGWHALDDPLDAAELDALGARPPRAGGLQAGADAPLLTPEDDALIQQLGSDGRMTYAALAAATGQREATAARRVEAMLERGTLYVSTEVATVPLGFTTTASLWITVAPGALERVGATLSDDPEVEFAGAVSGRANLAVSVTCRDNPDLYRYLTQRLGAIPAIRQLETVIARRLKQAGTVMVGDRLPSPLAPGA